MKHRVVRFKSLQLALKELEPFIRSGWHLSTGKPFSRFGGLRSRELLANWLICAAINADRPDLSLTFTTDPEGGDGILTDTINNVSWPTEHIFVPPDRGGSDRSIEEKILDAIKQKQAKGGTPYASGKTLIVFVDSGGGVWHPNAVTKQIPHVDFLAVWAAGLFQMIDDQYVYWVTQLLDEGRSNGGIAAVWIVRLGKNFETWEVERQQ